MSTTLRPYPPNITPKDRRDREETFRDLVRGGVGAWYDLYIQVPAQKFDWNPNRVRCCNPDCKKMIDLHECSVRAYKHGPGYRQRTNEAFHMPCFVRWAEKQVDFMLASTRRMFNMLEGVKQMIHDDKLWTRTILEEENG